MKMKRHITVTAALLLTCMLLSACGRSSTSSVSASSQKTGMPADRSLSAQETAETADSSKSKQQTDAASFSEVLEDSKNFYFAVTDLDKDGEWGYTMHVSMENRSDRDMVVTLNDVSINGVMAEPYWSDDINAGMKSEKDIVWATAVLTDKGITDVTEIQFNLAAYDADDPVDGYRINSAHTIYPHGKKAARQVTYTRSDGDQVLFDDKTCSMIITGINPEGEWGYTVDVCLVNKTDRDLMFASQDASVNDSMCDPYWSYSVAKGKIAFCQIIWTKEELENAHIKEVNSINLPVAVYDDDNYEEVRALKSFSIEM